MTQVIQQPDISLFKRAHKLSTSAASRSRYFEIRLEPQMNPTISQYAAYTRGNDRQIMPSGRRRTEGRGRIAISRAAALAESIHHLTYECSVSCE